MIESTAIAMRASQRPEAPAAGFGREVANTLAAAALVVGATVLGAWLLRPWLAIDAPILWLMKANTALCVVATSLATLLLVNERPDARGRLRRALGALVCAVTVATGAEYATDWQLGIDQLLATDPSLSFSGRMSPWTAAILALLAAATVLHASRFDRVANLALAGAGIALQLVWAGYLFGVVELYGVDRRTIVSPQTLLCASALGVALVAGRLVRGAPAIASRASPGGALIRTLLPAAWVLPLALGWLRLFAQWEGLIGSTQIGVAVFAVAQTLVLSGLIYWFATRIDAAERRWSAERERREDLERFVAICAWTGRVRWNGEWVRVERYLAERFGVQVTHTISEEAAEQLEAEAESPPGS